MGQKLVVGPVNKGLINNRLPFNIDNDSFPTLINAYQWRGRVKRKRGTEFLCRFQRFLGTTDGSGNLTVTISPNPIIPGIISVTIGTDYFVDPGGAGTVTLLTNSAGSATITYATGVLTITGSQIATNVFYYPTLPVMGLEEDSTTTGSFSGTLGFDTTYAYNILTASPYNAYDVSFYKNLSTGTYPAYVQKTNWTPTSWNGQNYQQFWSTNYEGAFWVTNGINIPFNITNIGMQYAISSTITYVSNTATTITVTIVASPLVVGDFVFLNEWTGTNSNSLNWQTGYVTSVVGTTYIITLPNAQVGAGPYGPGIIQYLTNRSNTSQDCIRWYDGDPTNGNATSPGFSTGFGWVNFMPPLSQKTFSIADLPKAIYYLVGARMIIPFKDRLCFIGPVIQTSSLGSQVYLQDTVIYSQNGTPYYTASFSGDPRTAATTALLTPINQTATASAYFEDSVGFGGNQVVGLNQPINTAYPNQDVILMGLRNCEIKMVYTGNDINPFAFFIINSELGTSSTFSGIVMDEAVLTRGDRGFVMTNQTSSSRFDLQIPDEVFEMSLTNNGTERVCAQRDFINEWVYFTYPVNDDVYVFPDQTLQYNYRDQSWAINYENYTTYGQFKKQTGFTWNTVGNIYATWNEWNDPWDAGQSTLEQPVVIGGNQQGFVLIRAIGTGEGTSLAIQNIVGNLVTSPNHCLNDGDFIIINGALGTIAGQVNGFIFQIGQTTTNTFNLDSVSPPGIYEGGATITRIYIPVIQTKQFPLAWDSARKTRIGVQQYLLTTTPNSQITLQIFLSQDANTAYNGGNIVPASNPGNSGLEYSQILYTCPESTNLGLTPFNTNLQMIANPSTGTSTQSQIWHRVNTSLIGDSVQLGFTMSQNQIQSFGLSGSPFVITGATQANPCVLTCASLGTIPNGGIIFINGVIGMTQLNGNSYSVISSNSTTVTIGVDSTSFTAYVSGGNLSLSSPQNAFAEIELHGFIMDVNQSSVLA